MQNGEGQFALPADGKRPVQGGRPAADGQPLEQSGRPEGGERPEQFERSEGGEWPGQFGQPSALEAMVRVFERAQTLLRAGEFGAARKEAQAGLDAYGPHPGLYLVLGRAHAFEDADDHDKAAERTYQMGLVDFPDHLDLLAAYAEFGLGGDALDEPGRVSRGTAAAARLKELAPDSPQAHQLGQGGQLAGRPPEPGAVQRYDARSALADGVDARAAAAYAAEAAAAWPYDRRLAVRAETLAALARPTAALARTRVRFPQLHFLAVAVLGAAIGLGVTALRLPALLVPVAALGLLPALQELYLLRAARDRAAAGLPADYRDPAPGAPELPRATRSERLTGALAVVVALGAFVGVISWNAVRAAEYPRYEASVPESVRGIPLSKGDPMSERMVSMLGRVDLPADAQPFSGLYRDESAGSLLMLVGVAGDLHDENPDRYFADMRRQLSALAAEPSETWTVDPGELGGRMECAVMESAGNEVTMCAWLDKGSMGMVFTGAYEDGDRTTLPGLTRELREATLRPEDPGAA
ncbi:hypothetical protein H9Y04_43085 [Streptomyces sp. TRM66268-LWL]|uniref:Tetratricopeptide repeat protein n=1 Tax=Streptomyces polyasparticus TaxID=2767826 RepID=A0ABR7SYI1_9ACTN|nr:hypothetical protein [Streptomyces polyasparticus]MBC9719318.1 hypothetical protein [Streptomyces polyasparticus]